MGVLLVVGLVYAVAFRLTGSVLMLRPLFQPMGQLYTLVRDGLTVPFEATYGFLDAIGLAVLLLWLAHRFAQGHSLPSSRPVPVVDWLRTALRAT
jgi:hypothetical protein